MGKLVDRTGHRYGLITVVGRDDSKPSAAHGRRVYWMCQCDCGGTKSVTGHDLQAGDVRSCGCAHSELISQNRKEHGHAPARKGARKPSPTYRSWQAAKDRCYKPNNSAYPRYGACGITMCARWRDSFENFLEDMGERPEGKTLDRIDGTLGYTRENCRWATMKEQTINRKVVRLFDWGGQRLTISDIARAAGMPRATLAKRYKRLGDINAAVASR